MPTHLVSKTLFLDFLYCPKNIWLKLHRPDFTHKYKPSEFERHLMEQGNEVESCARNLFTGGVEVCSTGEDAVRETSRLMASKVATLFQATFIVDGFIARNDMLSFNSETGLWDLYEVKGGNSVNEDGADHNHIDDIAFQVSVLNRARVPLGRYYLVHLNKDYVRAGDLDFKSLFIIEDETDNVRAALEAVEKQMSLAREYLNQEKEPVGGCGCVYRGRKKHCATFHYSNPHVPEYSVHDLSRINKKKLDFLIEHDIFDLNDIPEDFELSDNQKNQVLAHQRQKPMVDVPAIKDILGGLKFPLYFFDYEAYGPAIPVFNGFGPYKRIPFQFSLHILRDPDGIPEHIEFLQEKLVDPSSGVGEVLRKHFTGGTVIAWHKSYEAGVNKEIASRLPEYATLFESLNASLYDLKEVFSNQHYVHPGFKGSASIKKVLPVLVPNLKYTELDIHEGGQAANAWWAMATSSTDPATVEKISRDLKTYCGLDTYAMYAIWKHLHEMVKG